MGIFLPNTTKKPLMRSITNMESNYVIQEPYHGLEFVMTLLTLHSVICLQYTH